MNPISAVYDALQSVGLPTSTASWQITDVSPFGCTLTIDLNLPRRTFTTGAMFPSKKAAKEAAAWLAVDFGLLKDLQAYIRTPSAQRTCAPQVTQASYATSTFVHATPASTSPPTLQPIMTIPAVYAVLSHNEVRALDNPIGWLDGCANKFLHQGQKIDYLETGDGPGFGFAVQLTLSEADVRNYHHSERYTTKKAARKEACRAALLDGILEAFRPASLSKKRARPKYIADAPEQRPPPAPFNAAPTSTPLVNMANPCNYFPGFFSDRPVYALPDVAPEPDSDDGGPDELPTQTASSDMDAEDGEIIQDAPVVRVEPKVSNISRTVEETINHIPGASHTFAVQSNADQLHGASLRVNYRDGLYEASTAIEFDSPQLARDQAAVRFLELGHLERLHKLAFGSTRSGPMTVDVIEEEPDELAVPEWPKEPASYLNAYAHIEIVCEMMLGKQGQFRPVYQVTEDPSSTSQDKFRCRLTIPIDPPMVVDAAVLSRSKQAAKEAAAEEAKDQGAIDAIKAHWTRRALAQKPLERLKGASPQIALRELA